MSYVRYQKSYLNFLDIICITLIFCFFIVFSFDGYMYIPTEKSRYSHHWTLGLANYKGMALTTGCNSFGDCSFKTEFFHMTTLTWFDGPDFPYGDEEK